MTNPQRKKQRDYLLIVLNIIIVLLLISSVTLTIMGHTEATMAMAGPMGLLVLFAGMRRRRK